MDNFSHSSLSLNGGSSVAITPSETNNPDGTTSVSYDIGAVTGGTISSGASILLVYTADIQQTYQSGGTVKANDFLVNNASITYGLTAGASNCSDTSSATAKIKPLALSKEIINPKAEYIPGEKVTFRLTMQIPSGDTADVTFEDFFPLPVFEATSLTTDETNFGTIGSASDIRRAATDTLNITPLEITTDAAANKLTIKWPDINSTSSQVLAVEVDAVISDKPFSDDLSLTNLFQASTKNSPLTPTVDLSLTSIKVRSPELTITKGVLSTNNASSTISPAPASPVDGNLTNADAQDTVTFELTVENLGGAPAYDVNVSDDLGLPANLLSGCAIESVKDGDAVDLTYTSSPTFNGTLSLTNPLAANDETPAGGGPPYAGDTALIQISCDIAQAVEPGTIITNTSAVTWASGAGQATFPSIEDDATVTINNPNITKTLIGGPTFTIGDIIRYEIVITVPELTISNVVLNDTLDPGLAFVDFTNPANVSITNSSGVTNSVFSANVTNTGSTLALDLGTIENTNSGNAGTDIITISYDVVVLNITGNDAGDTKNNAVNLTSDNYDSATVRADNITITEPNVVVDKTVITTGPYDAGDTVTYDLHIYQSGSNLSDAFEVLMKDTLPEDVTYTAGSWTVIGACPNLSFDLSNANGTPATLNASWSSFTVLQECHIQYSVTLDTAVAAGTTLDNTVEIAWSSLAGTTPTAISAYNDNSCERTSAKDPNACGSGNDYDDSATAEIDINEVVIKKLLISTSEATTTKAEHKTGTQDLAIGETATFTLTITVPEGTSQEITITDNLPANAKGVMEYVSSNIISVGTNLSPDIVPTAVVSDARLSDGINDRAVWSFGQVVNNATDGVVDDQDRIIIEITGRMVDVASNIDGKNPKNKSSVKFGTGLTDTSQVGLDTVEPKLQIAKSSVTTTADGGDSVTYTIDISHASGSTQEAFDVQVVDIVPSGLTYVGPLQASCTTSPSTVTTDDSAPATTGLLIQMDNLPKGDTCQISFIATLNNSVNPGQIIINEASLDWDTLSADNDPDERSYSVNDDHTITVTRPGMSKVVFATSESTTGTTFNGSEPDLTVGEKVTYHFTATIPEGQSKNVVITDQLPTAGVALKVVSSEIVSVGAQVSSASLAVNDPGDACLALPLACDSNADTFRDQAQWNLGTVDNLPDGVSDTNDEIVFEVVAVVVDDSVNTGLTDDDVINTATLSFANDGGTPVSGTVAVDIVEPILNISKSATPVASPFFADAGDIITFELKVEHDASSSADAFNPIIVDTLANNGTAALMEWNGNLGGTCGASVNASGASATPFNVIFNLPTLALATSSCTITYQVKVATLAQPGETLQNSASLQYDSTPTFVPGETRRSTKATSAEVVINAPSLVKVVSGSSLGATGQDQHTTLLEDLTIGELVTYEITLKFPEGTTQEVILTDLMPTGVSGVIEVNGSPVIDLGDNVSTSQAIVTVSGAKDSFTIDFGTVTNLPDNVDNTKDLITVIVTGVVIDDTNNVDGKQPVNTATFTYKNGSPLSDTATVDVVEPEMAVTKSMTIANGLATITVNLKNNGTASAYDIEIQDVLDSANWDTSNILAVTVPSGFTLTTSVGPGATETTVIMASDGASTPPTSSVEPDETITFQFSVPVVDGIKSIDNTATNTVTTTMPGSDANERTKDPVAGNATLDIPLIELIKKAQPLADTNMDGEVGGVGDDITYHFTVTNTGNVDLSNVIVTDINPAVTVTGNPISLAVGESDSTTIKGTYTITQIDMDLGTFENTAKVTADGPTGSGSVSDDSDDPDNNTNNDINDDGEPDDPTIVILNQNPSMDVSKTTATTNLSAPGTISYNISVENDGNVTLTGVTLVDTLPDGSTGTLTGPTGDVNSDTKLDVTETWTYTISYEASQIDIDEGTTLTNTIGVTTTEITTVVKDTAETTITQLPKMTVTKVADPTTITEAGIINYTVTVKNTGNVSLTNVTPVDTLPGGGNGILVGPVGDSNTNGKLDITETWSYTTSYTASQIDIDTGATLTNNVGVTTSEITIPVTASADTSITQIASMSLDKTVNPAVANVIAGQTINYSYLVTNTGKVTIESISVSDVHSGTGSLSAINCPLTTLAPLATTTCTATYLVTQDDVDAGTNITNTATANGTPKGGTLVAPTDDETVTVASATPELTIVKTADANDKTDVVVGQIINYSYEVENTGNVTIDAISISDVHQGSGTPPVPAGGATSLVPGATTTYIASYIVTQEDIDAGVDITNIATATGTPKRGTLDPATDNESIDVANATPVLTILKTANLTTDIAVGQAVTYSYLVKNTGNVTVDAISISDAHQGSGTLSEPTGGASILAPGASTTFTATYIVTQEDIDNGVDITNIATANGTPKVGALTPPTDDESVGLVAQLPNITLDKSASAPTTALGINPDIVDPDDTITYTLVTSNTGNVTLSNVVVSDPLLTLTCGVTSNGDTFNNDGSDTLDLGESVTCTGGYVLTQGDIDAGGRDNKATANAADPAGNPVSGSDTVGSPLIQKTSIELLKTAGALTVNKGLDNAIVDAGDSIDYTFDIKNTGNVTLTNVVVTDQSLGVAPFNMSVDCVGGSNVIVSLAANASAQCSATYTLTQDDIDGLNAPTITNNAGVIELANTADVTGTPPADSGLTAPTAQSSATADAQLNAAITLIKSAGVITDKDGDGVDSVGDEITYTYEVTNEGVTTLTAVTVTEDAVAFSGSGNLPTPSNENSTNVSGRSTDATANDGVWDSLAPGDVVTFSAVYVLTQLDIDAGTVSNTAKVTGTPPAGLGTPEAESSVVKPITTKPTLTIVKSADDTLDVEVDQTITYSYLVANTGNVTIDSLAVNDTHNGSGTLSGISCPVSSLAPTETTTCTATYIVTQTDIDKGIDITNTATADGVPKGGSLTPVSDDERVDVSNPAPKLTIDKQADDTTDVVVGQIINYSYEVKNTGNVTIDAISVSDVHLGSGPAPVPSGGVTTLAPGESTTFTASYIVTQADVDAGVDITNTATANGIPKNGVLVPPKDKESVDVINPTPTLTIIKTANLTTDIAVGQMVTYSYLVKNTGNVTIDAISISDAHQGSGTLSEPAGGASSLAPGASTTFTATYIVTQEDIDSGVDITNIATANGTPKVGTLTPPTDNESVDLVDQLPNITLDKTASAPTTALGINPDIVDPGDTITYTLVATNTGNVTLSNVTVSDPLLTLTCGTTSNGDTFNNDGSDTLDLGESVICTGDYALTQEDIDAGGRDNVAAANATDPGSNPVSGSDTVGSPLVQKTSIELLKTAGVITVENGLDNTIVDAGDTIDYTFDVKNTGNVTLTNVTVTDQSLGIAPFNMNVDCGAGNNVIASLIANASAQCSARYTLTQDDIDGLNAPTITNTEGVIELANTADVTGTPPAGSGLTAPTAQSSATTDAQLNSAIALIKSAGAITDKDGDGVDSVGDEVTYTYEVTNRGVTTLTAVTVDEDAATFTGSGTLPSPGNEASTNASGLSNDATANDGVWDSLAPGDVVTFTAVYILTQIDVDAGTLSNTAKATGTPPAGLETPEAQSSVVKPITAKPALTMAKSADDTLDVEVDQTITYSYLVTNTGNVTIDNLAVDDTHNGSGTLSGISCPVTSLAPTETTTCTATYVVTQTDIDKGVDITNTATVDGTPKGGSLTPVSDDENVDVSNPLPKLTIDKQADDTTDVVVGQIINYTYEVKNTGNVTIDAISVSDIHLGSGPAPVPSGGATTLAPGESTTFTASYIVTQADVDAGVNITNTATANGTPKNGVLVPPKDKVSVDVIDRISSVTLVKVMSSNADEDTSNSVTLGDTLTYTIIATNKGNTTISNVTVSDNKINPSSINCTTLVPSASCVLVGTYKVTQSDVNAGKIDNIASVTTPDVMNIPDANVTTTVESKKAVLIEKLMTSYEDKDSTGNITEGDILTYEITATNSGTVTLTNIVVSDPLITPNSETCAIVAPGSTCVLTGTYTVTAADATLGKRDNTATVSSDQTDSVSTTLSVPIIDNKPPVADNDLSTDHVIGTPVVINPLANDNDPDGQLDPKSVRLIDASGNPVTTLIVDGEGEWTVDPVSGEITFTPEFGFTENPTPITYNVKDNKGKVSNNATVTVTYLPITEATIEGVVWLDLNNNGVKDDGETGLSDWTVKIFNSEGELIATIAVNEDGTFSRPGLDLGDYTVQFLSPGGLIMQEQTITLSVSNPLGFAPYPIDPAGIVYDELTGEPVAGARVSLLNSFTGIELPAACLGAGEQGQVTKADGAYSFLINPGADPACPADDTTYRLVVIPPSDYRLSFNNPPENAILDSDNCTIDAVPGIPCEVSDQSVGPIIGIPPYYVLMEIGAGDQGIFNNNIPLYKIDTQAIPTLSEWARLLLIMMLGLVMYSKLGRKRSY